MTNTGNAEPDDEKAEDEGKALPELDLDVELTREEDGGIRLGQLYIPPPPPPALTFDDDRPRFVDSQFEKALFARISLQAHHYPHRERKFQVLCWNSDLGPLSQEFHLNRGAQRKWQKQCD